LRLPRADRWEEILEILDTAPDVEAIDAEEGGLR